MSEHEPAWRKKIQEIANAPIVERPDMLRAIMNNIPTQEERNAALIELADIFMRVDLLKNISPQ